MEFVKGFLVGAFIVGIIMYFVGSNNPYPAAKKRLLAKASDVLKKVIPVLILISLLTSCNTKDYHNKITGRYISTQYRTMPMNDSIRDVIKRGLIYVDSSHAGNPLYYDSLYKVAFTYYQSWQSGQKGFLIAGVIVFVVFFLVFAIQTSRGTKGLAQLGWLVAAFLIGCPLIGAFYYYSPEKEIPKRDFIYYWNKDGSLENWWEGGFKAAPPDLSFLVGGENEFLRGDGVWSSSPDSVIFPDKLSKK